MLGGFPNFICTYLAEHHAPGVDVDVLDHLLDKESMQDARVGCIQKGGWSGDGQKAGEHAGRHRQAHRQAGTQTAVAGEQAGTQTGKQAHRQRRQVSRQAGSGGK